MGISSLNQGKSTLPSNSACSIFSNYEILAQTSNFEFWTKFTQNRYFLPKTEKVNITIELGILELVEIPIFNLNKQLMFWTKFTQ